MLKLLLVPSLFVSVTLAADNTYTTKYDNLNVEEILGNRRLLRNYLNCLLDNGNCSTEGRELKRALPDALKTDCSKCTDKQKDAAKKMIRYMLVNETEWYGELEKKYDPNGVYRKKYETELKG